MSRLFRPCIVLQPTESRLDFDSRPRGDGPRNGKSLPGLRFANLNSSTRSLHLYSSRQGETDLLNGREKFVAKNGLLSGEPSEPHQAIHLTRDLVIRGPLAAPR